MSADRAQAPFIALVLFLSFLTAALLLAVEIWLPKIGSTYAHAAGKSSSRASDVASGIAIKAAIVFAAALMGAARLSLSRISAGFFIGVLASVLYEIAMVLGALSQDVHEFSRYAREFSRYIVYTVLFCTAAGLAAGLVGQLIFPASDSKKNKERTTSTN